MAGVACCDVVTHGLGYDNGKVFLNTLDGYSVAIDASTGQELWHTKLADINKGETITMAPLVVKGKILIGNSGGEMGVRGWPDPKFLCNSVHASGHDASLGETLPFICGPHGLAIMT